MPNFKAISFGILLGLWEQVDSLPPSYVLLLFHLLFLYPALPIPKNYQKECSRSGVLLHLSWNVKNI